MNTKNIQIIVIIVLLRKKKNITTIPGVSVIELQNQHIIMAKNVTAIITFITH